MVKTLLIATGNAGKIKEMKDLLVVQGLKLVTPGELDLSLNIAETGKTYAQNAALKAVAYAQSSGFIALADDFGLEVDALDGAPGLYSARFSPKAGATDADRRAYLLERLAGKPQPWTARFRCVVAVTGSVLGNEIIYAEGVCEGQIRSEERGTGGFGYDPIFQLGSRDVTMAELSREEKNRLSHRARAVHAILPKLQDIFNSL